MLAALAQLGERQTEDLEALCSIHRSRIFFPLLMDEIKRLVWEGQILLEISPDPNDIEYLKQPDRFFVSAQRISYLSLLVPQTRKHFSNQLLSKTVGETAWFSSDDDKGVPLFWHYPIGLLYDLREFRPSYPTPWRLTIHFSSFPTALLPLFNHMDANDCATMDVLPSVYFSVMKQADYLRNGTGKIMNNLSRTEQLQLWEALCTKNYEKFWQVNEKIIGSGLSAEGKRVPLRCYILKQEIEVVQWPVFMKKEMAVEDVLNELRAELRSRGLEIQIRKAILHGIELPSKALIVELCQTLLYADNMLHIVILVQ
jgi:autophagy-related protein 5